MKRPLDATRQVGDLDGDARVADAPLRAAATPSKEEVERALARLVDSVLPDPRGGRRASAKRPKRSAT